MTYNTNKINYHKAKIFYKEIHNLYRYQEFNDIFQYFNERRYEQKLTMFCKNSFKKWAYRKFDGKLYDMQSFFDEGKLFGLIYNLDLVEKYPNTKYGVLQKYNRYRKSYFLPEISKDNIEKHICKFYGENINKFIYTVEKDIDKTLIFIDEIYDRYYDTMFKEPYRKTGTLKMKYRDFVKDDQLYKLLSQKQEFNSKKEELLSKKFDTNSSEGFIYAIYDSRNPEYIKVGKTNNLNSRISQYRTYTPFGDIQYLHFRYVKDRHGMEKRLIKSLGEMKAHGEWFKISEDQVIQKIEELVEI